MSDYKIEDYTFAGLLARKSTMTSLAYLIGLADSPVHKIADPDVAGPILSWLYDVEEQCRDAGRILERQEMFFGRFFSGGYLPQTPVMLTDRWSPISSVLGQGLEPITLKRSSRGNATGIWAPIEINGAPEIQTSKTPEQLFWAIFAKVCERAIGRGMFVSLIAKPGWAYDSPGILPKWSAAETSAADRVIWRRTPEN